MHLQDSLNSSIESSGGVKAKTSKMPLKVMTKVVGSPLQQQRYKLNGVNRVKQNNSSNELMIQQMY